MNFDRAICLIKLPRAGLGNKLFVWAQGISIAQKLGIKAISFGWTKIHIGPLLRREKSARFYLNYFKRNNILSYLNLAYLSLFGQTVCLSEQSNLSLLKLNNSIFKFQGVPQQLELVFDNLWQSRLIIRDCFFQQLSSNIKRKLSDLNYPVIGVHIRRGDFRNVVGESISVDSVAVRASIDYFIDSINKIRSELKNNVEVIIFSDGKRNELLDVLSLDNISLANNSLDILDLIELSRSKYIITSPGSTFSYFAAFLSDAIIIEHPLSTNYFEEIN